MKLLRILILFFMVGTVAANADLYDEIAAAIRSGDAHQVASYFDSKIDLALVSQEDIYSKAQAELLVKDFFSKNQAKSFTLVHKGSSKEGTLFAVGTLTCGNGKTFRVSYVIKSVKGMNSIQELRFENQ